MHAGDTQASVWARLFQCTTWESAERTLAGAAAPDRKTAHLAWNAHREAKAAAESRLAARARDLEALQAFGRAVAAASSIDDLMDRAASAVQLLVEADAVALAVATRDRTGVVVHLARALAPEDLARLREATALGFVPLDAEVPQDVKTLPTFDPYQGPRAGLQETDILVVPVERRGREILRMAVVPRSGPDERCVLAAFGASNHLAIHADRILTVADAEQGRFRAILDSMPHAVVLLDASFQLVHANSAGETLLARVGAEGGAAFRGVGDLDLVALSYDVLAGRTTGASAEAVLEGGGVLEVAVAPWTVGGGTCDGLVVVMLDVTIQRGLRAEVTRSEKLSSLGRMIAGVAHELNNPLTSVIGYAQLLRTMPPGDKLAARLATLQREADRCRRIVQNLLRFARVHTPERRPFSLNEVAENAALWLAYTVRTGGCTLELDLDREVPAVTGDVHDLEQVLVNLVTNALHAMTGAGRSGTITIRTRRAGDGRVALEVDDEGPGIPDSVREKLFDPFFTTKPAGQGTGLGLWLVENAVTAHGGTIRSGAAPGGGARFRIELPAAGAVDPPRERPAAESAGSSGVSARILVVDPEIALAELICEALAASGHEPVAVHDARAALDRLSGEPFDLVVSDASLPGLPGERLVSEIERVRPGLRQRILLTTADAVSREPEAVARKLDAGLLRKPFERDELREVVATRLRRGVEP